MKPVLSPLMIGLFSVFTTLSAGAVTLEEIVPQIEKMAADAAVVAAVKAGNAKGLSLDAIKSADKEWMDAVKTNATLPVMTEQMNNAAAKALTKAEKATAYLEECILTDNQGANVAITNITSDYWQGDEPKFTKAFADGAGKVYIAAPKKDKSTGEVMSQISVPVKDGGKAIGTLTVGVKVNKL